MKPRNKVMHMWKLGKTFQISGKRTSEKKNGAEINGNQYGGRGIGLYLMVKTMHKHMFQMEKDLNAQPMDMN